MGWGLQGGPLLWDKNLGDPGLWPLLGKRCLGLLLWPHPTTRGQKVCACVCVQVAERQNYLANGTGGAMQVAPLSGPGDGFSQLVCCPSQWPQVSRGWLDSPTFSCCEKPLRGVPCSPSLLMKKLMAVGSAHGSPSRRASDGL